MAAAASVAATDNEATTSYTKAPAKPPTQEVAKTPPRPPAPLQGAIEATSGAKASSCAKDAAKSEEISSTIPQMSPRAKEAAAKALSVASIPKEEPPLRPLRAGPGGQWPHPRGTAC